MELYQCIDIDIRRFYDETVLGKFSSESINTFLHFF